MSEVSSIQTEGHRR